MDFYNFNLPYNYWFEKELFFKYIVKDTKIDLGVDEIIKLYKKFVYTLKDRSEYLIDSGYKNDLLKIVFTIVEYINIRMVKEWSKYNLSKNIFIRQAEIYMVDNNKGDKTLY
jgi:hypothetical protein